MINHNSIKEVDGAVFSSQFRKPLYDSYCFSNIPGTIETLLTGKSSLNSLPLGTTPHDKYDKVVLFLVDAFGWCFFEKYKDKYPILKRFIQDGMVSKITSQFPSTTAAHVTTIHTGEPVGKSGVFEWHYYEPKVDNMITPLLFSYVDDNERNTLSKVIDPNEIFPNYSLYKKLDEKNIQTYLFQSAKFTPSPYGDAVSKGVKHVKAFEDWESGLVELSKVIKNEQDKAYFYFYYGDIDSVGHDHGLDSETFEKTTDAFFRQLETLFLNEVMGQSENTLMILTADHGQTAINPSTTAYVDILLPDIINWNQTNKKGQLLAPGGSSRDLFLYIKEEYTETAIEELKKVLNNKAEIYPVNELLEKGLFGRDPSGKLKDRLGNICILPYEKESVFWWGEGKYEQKMYGHHGGLTPEEMDSVFLTLEL